MRLQLSLVPQSHRLRSIPKQTAMGIPFPRQEPEQALHPRNSLRVQEIPQTVQKKTVKAIHRSRAKSFIRSRLLQKKVFYLVIDRDGDEEKVYFLTEVSENDLLNTTSDNSETLPKNSAALESAIPVKDAALDNNNTDATGNKKQDAETVEENTEESTEEGSEPETTEQKQDGSGFSYLIMGIAAAAVIGVVYIIKVKKKKENFIDDDEDELEDDYEEDYDDEDGEEADPDEDFLKNTEPDSDDEEIDTTENDTENEEE